MAKKKAKTQTSEIKHPEVSLLSITQEKLREYGAHVVEQRAVPDIRDGLKPVVRVSLWAAYKLGMHSNTKFRKSALLVGDVIGKYHPHGDSSVYDAIVGVAGVMLQGKKEWRSKNTRVPLFEGFGNWGSNIDEAGAYRYTECRLSEFSEKMLLDPAYLAVTPMLPNFDDTLQVPLYLPAKLPLGLLNGSTSIAVGISQDTPSFEVEGIVKLITQYMQGTEITAKDCVSALKFSPTYGGECISSKKEKFEFFKTGKGSLSFMPVIETSGKEIHIRSFAPGMNTQGSLETLANQISKIENVKTINDESGAGGFCLSIVPKSVSAVGVIADELNKILLRKCSVKFNMGVTIRSKQDLEQTQAISFRNVSVPKMLNHWCKWRLSIEAKVLKYLQSQEELKLARQQLLIKAIDNLQIIIDALRAKDTEAYLVKKLKITEEEAKEILSMQVRQLKSLEKKKVVDRCKEHQKQIDQYQKDLKNPSKRILRELEKDKSVLY